MYKTLFRHYWLGSLRSPGYYKNLVVNIFVGLMTLYFLVVFVMLGLLLPKILQEIAPGYDPATTFNGGIIYAVIALLMIRYLMQPLSRLNLQSYQVLPVKRSTLVNYLMLKPLLNPLNYATLCLAIPFSITGVYPTYGIAGAFRFLVIILFLIWFNTLLAPLLKRKFSNILLGTIVFSAHCWCAGSAGIFQHLLIVSTITGSIRFSDRDTLDMDIHVVIEYAGIYAQQALFCTQLLS